MKISRGFNRYDKEIKRFDTCNRCRHSCSIPQNLKRSQCLITNREGNVVIAEVCEHFEYHCPVVDDSVADDGLKYRSKQGRELLTESQWNSHGFKLKDNAVGEPMHPTKQSEAVYTYYDITQVEAFQ